MIQEYQAIKINLASPQKIKEWSEITLPNGETIGEITESDTINYRTHKPERNGLFCQKIFGPIKDWECICGLYKNEIPQVGLICDVCGVAITESRVRRHRMGYINLLHPVVHIWYLRGNPNFLSSILQLPLKKLEETIYGKNLSRDLTNYQEFEDFILEGELLSAQNQLQGAEIIFKRLKGLNLTAEIENNRILMMSSKSTKTVEETIKRIRIFENFLATGTKPEWMVFTVLPVLPPGLRPIVQLENGRLATSDLNEFYRKIIIRTQRLGRLLSVQAPSMIIFTEKRMIQESVDALIDNGKRGPKVVDLHKRPLKSLAEMIEGKQGRFRQNLLGKRVDYSGRSVIVVGPKLHLNQCGLPYEMAIELFLPFLIHKIFLLKLAGSIKTAKKIIYGNKSFIWYLLKEVLTQHPIILNRAPTLHRLGVQAFDPILVAGRAIQLHPLVCPAFNADFDGDQMAVHIPLSLESQLETRLCLLSTNNFLSPGTGDPNILPSQDMVLGFYYLTSQNTIGLKGNTNYFSNFYEVLSAYEQKRLHIHSSIWVRCPENFDLKIKTKFFKTVIFKNENKLQIYDNLQRKETKTGRVLAQYIRTTPGRIIFNVRVNEILR